MKLATSEKRLAAAEAWSNTRLAVIPLESLDVLSKEEHQRLWAEMAVRRGAELDADPFRGRFAEISLMMRAHDSMTPAARPHPT
ncbi:addiction module protein [Sorangium sp. KYC3313]|uniref:addiction module protein n=1 Tax=Sorangium sp. KYC3313 TaxID=3449740 RepID=UPI003F8CADC0